MQQEVVHHCEVEVKFSKCFTSKINEVLHAFILSSL